LFTGDRIFGTLCPKTGFSAEFLGSYSVLMPLARQLKKKLIVSLSYC
jgi:hypothetical protein